MRVQEGGPVEPGSGGGTGGGTPWLWIILGVGAVVLLGCPCMAVIAAIAIPNLLESRKGGNESAAIGNLRTIASAQQYYRETDKDKNDKLDYAPDLRALAAVDLVDQVLAGGTKQGYVYAVRPGTEPESTWSATADPLTPGATGDRHFFVDESGVIRFDVGRPAGPTSRAIGH